jgi:hypothetical protein
VTRSPNILVARVLGAALLALGALGFAVTTGEDFTADNGGLLLGLLLLNGLQNCVHLLLGAALLACGFGPVRRARTGNSVVAVALFLLGILGLFITGTPENFLSFNGADNVLHFGLAVVLLAVSVGGERTPAS